MKHKPGRRYGCPCNAWADACGTCEYAVRACRPTNAWEQLGQMIKEAAAIEDPIEDERRRKVWEEIYPSGSNR